MRASAHDAQLRELITSGMTRIADRVALLLAADPVAAPTVSAPSTTLRAPIGMTIATGQHADLLLGEGESRDRSLQALAGIWRHALWQAS
ncbi:hypothetical protein H0264_22110 [Nocardia huaxiensis]|uniref:Uncharacterized protein n=1 Tax=Nocardia huaxiensis TaxID=2755382 RepID=A0A7D6V5Q6_9NOCA|nr:hypothetical protein [Nocardia huaxiensis]QLY28092.1 hypothetical protein H0264_22110 [Nocardia huaxiensis]